MARQTNGEGESLAAFHERARELVGELERVWRTLPQEQRAHLLKLIEGIQGEGPGSEEEPAAEEPFWLKRELDARGWSERRFGRLIGCTAAHANYLARGEKGPGPELARRMAEELSRQGGTVTEQQVLRAYGKLSPLPDGWDEKQERRLVEAWRGLDAPERAQAVEFVRFLGGE